MRMATKWVMIPLMGLILFWPALGRSFWEWHNPMPAGNDLYALDTSDTGYLATGGDAGLVLEYSNGQFVMPEFRTFERINDISLNGESGIAVCERGDVLLRNRGAWEINKPASTAWFYGASILPDGTAWICGDSGKIFHYDGSGWTEFSSSTSATLKDVEFFDEDHGWAVGLFGTVRVWNGSYWQYTSAQTSRFLRKVSASSAQCAWAVGDLGTIIRWNGSGFQLESTPTTANLFGVAAVDDDEAWAVGEAGVILHRLNGTWTLAEYPELPIIEFRSIEWNAPGDIWITGRYGFIAHFNGSVWERFDQDQLGGLDVNDVTIMPATGSIILAGERGRIWEYNGSEFIFMGPPSPTTFHRLRPDNDNRLWAAGEDGALFNTDGISWNSIQTGNSDDYFDLDIIAEDNIWVAGGGSDGTCVKWTVCHFNGSDWRIYSESST